MKLGELVTLKEGGAATSDAGTVRIRRSDIPATIKYASELSGIPVKDLHKLGSTGKTPDSGDIDLGVDVHKYDAERVHARMIDKLGPKGGVFNKGTKVGSYAVPIKGDPERGLVQVDFMYTPNTDWAKFAYYSEGEGSKYKGAVRTILLMAVAAGLQEPGTDHFEFDPDSGDITVRAGRTLDLNAGLRRIFQHRPRNKKGDAYLKTMKTIPMEDFRKMFPDVPVKDGIITIEDPEKVVKMLFGRSVTSNDVRTAEQVLELIRKKFDAAKQEEIFTKAKERASRLVGKMRLPPELMDET